MKGILVIAHGSRAKETEATLDAIISMVKTKLPELTIECAFMEFSERTVEKSISSLIKSGVTDIKVVPYFLFMGIHLKKDIPGIVKKCTEGCPGIKVTMGEPLGVDKRIADILIDRILS